MRICIAALGCLALAHCSATEKFARKDSKNSERVAEDVEIAKGGGRYKVGKPYSINGRPTIRTKTPNYRAEGVASWYGPDFHGRLTANGEIYDMHGYSAAHTTLPLPSYARVTNLSNGKSIIVRVNNRGPFAHNRLIDLSIGTAKALDFYGHGLARVRVEYVGRAPIEGSDDRMLLATLREGSPGARALRGAWSPRRSRSCRHQPRLPAAAATAPRPCRWSAVIRSAPPGPALASSESKPVARTAAKPARQVAGSDACRGVGRPDEAVRARRRPSLVRPPALRRRARAGSA